MFESTETAEEILKDLGVRLSELRLSRGLTQEDLAQRAGVSKRSLERLEKSEGNPRLSVLVSVCQVLGLVQGFDALVPAVELGPMALAAGKSLPKRARKAMKKKAVRWGDES